MASLTVKEQKFIHAYIQSGNGSEAVRKAGYKINRPDQQAYELLRKPEIAAEIAKARKGLQEEFKEAARDAFKILVELMNHSKRDSVRLQAARDLLDRAGYRPDEVAHLTVEQQQKQGINEAAQKKLDDDFADFLKIRYGKKPECLSME